MDPSEEEGFLKFMEAQKEWLDPVEDEIILKTHDARMERWKKRMASRASSEEERLPQSMDAYIERMKSQAHVMDPPDQE